MAEDSVKPPVRVVPAHFVFPFVLTTSLFALWGFANDITNPMVAAFKNILLISNFESSLVQFAFYGGYCVMAIPAAIFIKRFSYQSGLILGLALYAVGCLLFIPSGWMMAFWAFLLSYFVMTCGLSFLETSANPFILSLGGEATATRRLNLAQAFNPMGSLTGMLIAKNLILQRLDPMDEVARDALAKADPAAFQVIARHDLGVIIGPYAVLGLVVLAVMVVFIVARLPRNAGGDARAALGLGPTLARLGKNRRYIASVVAQTFYVGVQIMCWTFIIHYAEATLGLAKADAQFYNMIAMVCFVTGRFICTFLLRFFNPGTLLVTLAAGGLLLVGWAIFGGGNPEAGALLQAKLATAHGFPAQAAAYLRAPFEIAGMSGLMALVGVSACMSLMFPTIYGIALEGLGDDAKLAAAGLILAIGGGCLMPPLQGLVMDLPAFSLGALSLASVRASFVLPLLCFAVILAYGWCMRAGEARLGAAKT
ncbi:MAG: L-fucose:H+ symporter permease [Verrucomicrobiota bacterium]|jgi:FHS family L-fucose permease-like MFS transporter|nr:L-fucose:H+ symporter permease [Verrucomicrobiota bacterium]